MTGPASTAGLAAAMVSLAIAGCGGASSKSSTTTSSSTAGVSTSTSGQAGGGTDSVSTGPVHGSLRGQNHAPRVNRLWNYSVRVLDTSGHPLSGSVEIQFVYGGQVVGRDTPPSHPVTNGRWHDNLKFPAAAVGMPLTFRAVVHTAQGSITLDWPVTVAQ